MGLESPISRRQASLRDSCAELMRDNASRVVLLHRAVAEELGLGPTDLKCLDLFWHEQVMTPSRLAESTGLTAPAITAVLDRLERGRFVERIRDGEDRRRVVVRATAARSSEGAWAFAPLAEATQRVLERFSLEELELLEKVLRDLNRASDELIPGATNGRPAAATG